MNSLIDTFNNREKSLVVWLLIIFIVFLIKKAIRKSFFYLFKAFAKDRILIAFALMTAYTFVMVYIHYAIDYWNISMFKDTVIWFFSSAFVLFVNCNKILKDNQYFIKVVVDTFKWIIIFEFIVNLYVFNLATELVLLPILTLAISIIAFADTSKGKEIENASTVKSIMTYISTIAGFLILTYALYNIVISFQNFATLDNLYTFLLPLILSSIFLPFMYILGLYLFYENIFGRSNHWLRRNKPLAKYMRYRIFVSCLFNIKKLRRFSTEMNFMVMKSKEDVLKEMQEFEEKYKDSNKNKLQHIK